MHASERFPPGRFCAECGATQSQPTKFGDYEVESVVGEGGMGRVYKARQARLKRSVCVKTLLPQFARDEAVVARFEREASTTAALNHPNIVSIIDVGRAADGGCYFVMEHIEGKPLRQIFREEAPLPPARAVALISQVLAALSEAHANDVVHRDLKPSNVLVVNLKDGGELCKVLDFGIARCLGEPSGEQLTRTGMMLGTPGYMAPEQMTGGEFDHRVDLYAAGTMLYELLAGQRMFRAPNETELLRMTLLEDPPPPSTRTSTNVPAALDQVCLKAVSRDPRTRYASAVEFREALTGTIGYSSAVSMIAAQPALQVDTTPLASATTDARAGDATNPRTLLAAVLAATEPWELSRLLDALERSLHAAIAAGQTSALALLLRAVQDAAKERRTEALTGVVTLLRAVFLQHLETLLTWARQPEHAQVAAWLFRLMGREATTPLLTGLERAGRDEAATRVHALRLAEPKVADLVERVRALAPPVMKAVMAQVHRWPEADALGFCTAALNSPQAPHRQAALEGLDEGFALRNVTTIRVRLHDPHPAVRAEALKWIFRLEDEGAAPELARLLERPATTPAERRGLYRVLAHLGGASMTSLVNALMRENDPASLTELVALLARSGDEYAVSAITSAARDPVTPRPLRQLCLDTLKQAPRVAGP